jgi:hypothetical protein
MKPVYISTPAVLEDFIDEFLETPEWLKVHKRIWDDTDYVYVKLDQDPKGLRLWFGKKRQLARVWDVEGDGDDFSIYAVFAMPNQMTVLTLNLNTEAAE